MNEAREMQVETPSPVLETLPQVPEGSDEVQKPVIENENQTRQRIARARAELNREPEEPSGSEEQRLKKAHSHLYEEKKPFFVIRWIQNLLRLIGIYKKKED